MWRAVPGRDRVLLAEVARMARVGRAAVVSWRRRHADFLAPTGGTEVHPQFDRAAVVAWLLAQVPRRRRHGRLHSLGLRGSSALPSRLAPAAGSCHAGVAGRSGRRSVQGQEGCLVAVAERVDADGQAAAGPVQGVRTWGAVGVVGDDGGELRRKGRPLGGAPAAHSFREGSVFLRDSGERAVRETGLDLGPEPPRISV